MADKFLTGLDVNGNIDLTGGVIDLNKNQLQNVIDKMPKSDYKEYLQKLL